MMIDSFQQVGLVPIPNRDEFIIYGGALVYVSIANDHVRSMASSVYKVTLNHEDPEHNKT